MANVQDVETQRNALLDEMRSIRSMMRGTINEQYFKSHPQGKSEPVIRGPYYVLSRREGKKTLSVRLTSPAELERAKTDVAGHKRFTALCQKFERLTERLGELERKDTDLEIKKKRRRSPSSRTKKSQGF